MSMNEITCPIHGPYSASEGSCPICRNSGRRPKAPTPLDEEDETETDLGQGRSFSDSSTALDDMPTNILQGRGNKGGINLDNEETSIGRNNDLDHTTIKSKDKKPPATEVLFWQRNGNRRGKILPIKNQDTIGRGLACKHNLDGDGVSELHAKITLDEDQYYIWDLGSTNGTFINGEQIYGRTPLKENDIVGIDDFEFIVKLLN